MDKLAELQAQNLALRVVVIAMFSLHPDRQLLEARAKHFLPSLLAALDPLERKNAELALGLLVSELHSLGYPL